MAKRLWEPWTAADREYYIASRVHIAAAGVRDSEPDAEIIQGLAFSCFPATFNDDREAMAKECLRRAREAAS